LACGSVGPTNFLAVLPFFDFVDLGKVQAGARFPLRKRIIRLRRSLRPIPVAVTQTMRFLTRDLPNLC
jgi:hypothetical protein